MYAQRKKCIFIEHWINEEMDIYLSVKEDQLYLYVKNNDDNYDLPADIIGK